MTLKFPRYALAAALATLCTGVLLSACGGGSESTAQNVTEPTPSGLRMSKIGGFAHAGGAGAAEIAGHDAASQRLFLVNGAQSSVDVLSIANPATPTLVGRITTASLGPGLGGVNSVAVHSGVVALAVEANPKTNPGVVVFLRANDLTVLHFQTVGALPDMLTFTPDGKLLLVANEGEPSSYGQTTPTVSIDPEGSVSVIEVAGLAPNSTQISTTHTLAGFAAFNSQVAALRQAGVRIFGPNASVAQDLEPEYIAVAPDGKTAWVTLQENNAVAELDLAQKRITAVLPLGLKDHSVAGYGMDPSDEDAEPSTNTGSPTVAIRTVTVSGMYQPDAIASYQVGNTVYYVTANEGDAREYTGFNEEVRVRAHCTGGLNSTRFADAVGQLFDSALGRLRVTNTYNPGATGKDAAGACDTLYAFGGRSFSIWTSAAAGVRRVFDSGDDFERRTAALVAGSATFAFNASNDNNTLDSRSPAKGPEPEGVVLARFGSKTFAFIGLERAGGVLAYDITDPAAPKFETYLNTRTGATGDRGPEGLLFIPAERSPTNKPMLIVGNETSGTTAVFQIELL